MRALEDDLSLLETAVQDAGEIALGFWRGRLKSWDKGGTLGPVSEADLAVNDALEARLRGARPEYGWLSEESADDPARLAAERCFIVDPIDGTRAYIEGADTFAVSVGISEGGRMRAGAVWLPALKRLYSAHRDGAARFNGQEIHASTRADLAESTMLTTAPNMKPEHWPGGVPSVRRAFRPSLAYRLSLVAEGRHDSMVTFRDTWEWDVAAASLIAQRAGAVVTDAQGRAPQFNRADPRLAGMIAAGPAIHPLLIARATSGA